MDELILYTLFEDIISKSKVMKRFVTAPGYGTDLNKNNLGQIVQDAFEAINDGVKYPLCMMFPPVEFPNFDVNWSKYNCKLFFLTPPFNNSKGTANRNPFSSLSQHTVQETWKDMNVCAKGFYKFLTAVIENNTHNGFRYPESAIVIERFTGQGNDAVAGVSLTFEIELAISCDLEDYSQEDIKTFIINTSDLHPHHEH